MAMTTGKANINMTPLIDVLLVLLIIFMVILPHQSVGLPAAAPHPAEGESPNDGPIVISVNPDGSLAINQEPVPLDRLEARLREIFARRSDRVVFVRGHRELEFRSVARVIDIARGAGIINDGLMEAF
jgi:biopolymer transport protein TolR